MLRFGGGMARVFLSYARENQDRVAGLAGALERAGHQVWWDRRIAGGAEFQREIERELAAADVVVVAWSAAACESHWVRDEAAAGRDTNRLVPVTLDGSEPPLGFRQFHVVDLSPRTPGSFRYTEVRHAVAAKAGEERPPGDGQASDEPVVGRLWRALFSRSAALAILLVLAVSLAGLWLYRGPAPDLAGQARMKVQLLAFERQSPNVDQGFVEAFPVETLSAIGEDGVVQASLASADEQTPGVFTLRGTVRRVGAGIRVALNVTNRSSNAQLWTHSFDFTQPEIQGAPQRVGLTAATMLRCALSAAAEHPTPLPDRTIALLFQFCAVYGAVELDLVRAADIARRITVATPDFSRGWSMLAIALEGRVHDPARPGAAAARTEGENAFRTALRLDPRNSEAWVTMAFYAPASALIARERYYLQAVSARPLDCGCAHTYYADFLAQVGRTNDALEQYRRAIGMNAIDSSSRLRFARALLAAGQREEARRQIARTIELFPTSRGFADGIVIRAALANGDYDDALRRLAASGSDMPAAMRDMLVMTFNALRSNVAGERARTAAAIAASAEPPNRPSATSALALAALGDDRAALAVTARLNPFSAQNVLQDPALARARQSPGFAPLAEQVGLVRYWRERGRRPDFCQAADAPALCRSLG